tara:strand:+ start:78 stop:326 length:249 start_codon:yes stop_codon:yes gene_type:complete
MKRINWKITILNPVNEEILECNTFENITEISKKYKKIPLSTWRNIALGRSKIYKKFVICEKVDNSTRHIESDEDEKIVITFD